MFCLIFFDTFDCHKLLPTIDDSLLIPEVIKCPACTVVIFSDSWENAWMKRNRQNRNRKQWETMSQCPLLKSNLTFPVFSVHPSSFYLVHHLRPLWSWILLPMSGGAKDRSWYRIVAVAGCWERSSLHLRRLEHAVYAAQSRQWADCSSEAFKGVECEGGNLRK